MSDPFASPAVVQRTFPEARLVADRDATARALEEAGGGEGLVVVTIAASPAAPLEALIAARPEEDAVLWDPPAQAGFAGVGRAREIVATGSDRWRGVRDGAAALWRAVRSLSPPGTPPPRLFGGLAFQAGRAQEAPWEPFGDAWFVLPRAVLARSGDRAWLSLCARAEELGTAPRRAAVLEELEDLRSDLGRHRGLANGNWVTHEPVRTEGMGERDWHALVEAARDLTANGRFEKIVTARRIALEFDRPIDVLDVLARLRRDAVTCTRFAFRRGPTTFLGATPERLVSKRASAVETEALAGSIRAGSERSASDLLASAKDLSEHAPVLREIVRCLGPLCESVRHPEVPEVRELRHLLHLRTPVSATLRAPAHVLDLVERLHPTPAVGGVPTADAVQWIASHEPCERGWYAAPIGWFDAGGDGDFDVALRAGVVRERHAYLYAGGGIVRDSDPSSEYLETRLKLAALLGALGVPP